MPDAPDRDHTTPNTAAGSDGPPLTAGCAGAAAGGLFAVLTLAAFGATVLYALDRTGVIQWGPRSIPPLKTEALDDLRRAPAWNTGHQFVYRVRRSSTDSGPTDEAAALDYRIVFEIVGVEQSDDDRNLSLTLRRHGGIYPSEERTWTVTEECLRDSETGETLFCRDGPPVRLQPKDRDGHRGDRDDRAVLPPSLEAFRWESNADPPIRSAFRPDLGLLALDRPDSDNDHGNRRWSYRLAGWSSTDDLQGGVSADAVFTCDWHDEVAKDADVDTLPTSREHRYEEAAADAGLGADVDVRTLELSGRNLADRAVLLSNQEGTLLVVEKDDAIVARHRLPDRTYATKVWRGRDTRPGEAGRTVGPEVLHILMARGSRLRLALVRIGPRTAHGLTWALDRRKGHDRYTAHMLADRRACYFQFRNRQPDGKRLVADFELTDEGFEKRRGRLKPATITRFSLTP